MEDMTTEQCFWNGDSVNINGQKYMRVDSRLFNTIENKAIEYEGLAFKYPEKYDHYTGKAKGCYEILDFLKTK